MARDTVSVPRAELRNLVARIENVRTHIGSVGNSVPAVVARLAELGDISQVLHRIADQTPGGDQ